MFPTSREKNPNNSVSGVGTIDFIDIWKIQVPDELRTNVIIKTCYKLGRSSELRLAWQHAEGDT